MIDLKLTKQHDLEITADGDISPTQSVCQAVKIRLLWFLNEWRLGPSFGFPYYEEVFIKRPSDTKIRHLIRETVKLVDEVTEVKSIDYSLNNKSRNAYISVVFCTDEDTYTEEAKIVWQTTD